jgi:hypothetical protein
MGENREELKRRLKRWEDTTLREYVRERPEWRKEFITTSSVPIRRLYTPLDLPPSHFDEKVGLPGEYPFTRGVHPTMYRGRPWTMRMFSGLGLQWNRSLHWKKPTILYRVRDWESQNECCPFSDLALHICCPVMPLHYHGNHIEA